MLSSTRGTHYLISACLAAFALGVCVASGRSNRRAVTARARDAERAARLEHDLRTPIGTIASAASLLQGAAEDVALRNEAIEVIERQVTRLSGIAHTLGQFARELGQAQGSPTETCQPPHR